MAKVRQNVKFFLATFEGKTKEEAEEVVKKFLIGCERPIQETICRNAIGYMYGIDGEETAEEVESINEKIKTEFETGVTKKYLRDKYGLTIAALNKIVDKPKVSGQRSK